MVVNLSLMPITSTSRKENLFCLSVSIEKKCWYEKSLETLESTLSGHSIRRKYNFVGITSVKKNRSNPCGQLYTQFFSWYERNVLKMECPGEVIPLLHRQFAYKVNL